MELRKYTRFVAAGLLLLQPLWGAEYRGQVKFGTLPLPGASLTATQGDKKVAAVSDMTGTFSFADLPDGTWSVSVEMSGFAPAKQDVTPGNGLPGPVFDLKMLPMDQMEAVATPAAPVAAAAAPVQTTTAAPAPVAAPPSIGKPSAATAKAAAAGAAKPATAFQRTDLGPAAGASAAAPEPPPAPEVTSELSSRAADASLINGSSVNGAASPFAQSQAFGNSRKGARSLYTGNFGFIVDNSALDARTFSLTGQDTPKPNFDHMTGLFSFGGPVKIPHLITRNGPNFQLNYSRVRNHNATVQTGLMPDALERTGDFSQELNVLNKPVQIYDPTNGQPFAGNIIPASRITAQAKYLQQFYPASNFAGGARYNYQVPVLGNTHSDSLSFRIQKSFKRKNFMSGSYNAQDTRGDNDNLFNFLDTSRSLGQNTSVSYRRTFTSRFFGTVTYNFSRQSTQNFPFFANTTNVSALAGITGNNQQAANWGPPSLAFTTSGIAGLSDNNSSAIHNETNSISYDSSWSHNRHNITFGGDIRFQQFNSNSQQNPRGGFTFTGASTQQIIGGVAVPGTGSDYAGFLLGIPDASRIAFGNADKYLRSKQDDLYFTDDWRVSPSLTLNVGARWEYGSPIIEKYGRLVNLDIASGFTAVAPVVASNPKGTLSGNTFPESLIQPDKHGIQPRIGFSWRPFPASSMLVKGGYGVYYNTSAYQAFANQMSQQSPLSTSLNVQNTLTNPLTLANGFNAPANVITNTFAIDPNFKVGYSQNWQLSVQRDLPFALIMNATYAGVKGTRAIQASLPNTNATGAVNPCPSCPSGFTYLSSNGNSTRESGSLQLRRRLHNGFTAQVQYTFAKAIDDAAALGGGGGGGNIIAQDWRNLSGDRGLSSFDQRHVADITMQYTSGMGVGGGTLLAGWRGKLVKDWTFTDNIHLATGLPLNPVYSSIVNGSGSSGSIRPNFTGASIYDAPSGLFLNPLAFTAPAAGQWGNAARNSITGPDQFTMNASMSRAFRLNDRFTANLSISATNPLNHVTFPNWVTTTNSPQFGLPTAANAMRGVTTNLRVTF